MLFMKKVFITLSSIDDVKVFVNEINMLPCDADLVSGRYTVDAKSIMGIFSLDLSKSIELDLHCDDEAVGDTFLKKIAPFVTSK